MEKDTEIEKILISEVKEISMKESGLEEVTVQDVDIE